MTRPTETRLPEGLTAEDFGQASVSGDGKAALISYYTSPVTLNRKQTYVVFILDDALENQVTKYQWQVRLEDKDIVDGVWEYTPDDEGEMTLNVTLQDNSNTAIDVLSLTQEVVLPNQELETMIALDDQTHPIAGDPTTSREVINDFLAYIHELAPVNTEEELNRLLFGVAYVEAFDHNQASRDALVSNLANAVNRSQFTSFYQQASVGAGVCRIRPEILAMTPQANGNPLIPWEEFPTESAARRAVLQRIQASLVALPDPDHHHHIDIFNLLRFPKANLRMCKQIFDALRNRYFNEDSYDTIFSNPSRVQQLINNFKIGPLASPP